MTLITKTQIDQLLANGIAQRAAIDQDARALDFKPVVKLFTPDAQCTWLLTEIDEDTDLAFGLCDLGMGEPELGYVSLIELATEPPDSFACTSIVKSFEASRFALSAWHAQESLSSRPCNQRHLAA